MMRAGDARGRDDGILKRSRQVLLAAAMTAVLPTFAHGQSAPAAQTVRAISVPPGPLTPALNRLAAQTGLQILFDARLAEGKTTRGAQGSMTASQALSAILTGTGVSARFTAPNAATIGDLGQTQGLILDPVVVMATNSGAASGSGFQGTPDWVYEAPASVSVVSREAITNSPSRNARDLLDNVAGVYANRSESQNPGISVNIRGLQDQTRIATMIDGARQNFQRNAHGSTQRTYVDTAFVRGIEVEKSGTSGVGGAGALGGLVNFRTLLAEDLIEPGKKFGGEVNLTTGTNEFNFDGSTSAAVRITDSLSVLAGISHKNIGAYKTGQNGEIKLGATYTGDVLLYSGQEVVSTILKAEADLTDDMKLTLGWVHNDSRFNTGNYDFILTGGALQETTESVMNDTFTSALDWKPDGSLIDLKARFYYNHIKDDKTQKGPFSTGPSSYTMATLGGSIENTSSGETLLGSLSFNYGAEAFRDDGKTILDNGFSANGVDYSSTLSGGTPSGKRDVASGFANATLKPSTWLTVSGGLRYDWYHLYGNTTIYGNEITPIIGYNVIPPSCFPSPPFPPNVGCTPGSSTPIYGTSYYQQLNMEVDKSGGALLPTFTVAVKPVEWLQPFVKYSKSFRPPTIMESFINGGHDSNSINGYAPNPNLKPERANIYELGVNISRDGIFTGRDKLRLKAVGFYREIEDYISFGYINNSAAVRQYDSFVNLNGTTRMKGYEIETNYDAGTFYVGASITGIETDFAESYITPAGRVMPINARGAAIIFVQPKQRVTIDAGVRLFDGKLTLGGRVMDVAATEPELGSLRSGYELDGYRIYDIYGSYAFNDKTKLRFAINNVTDVAYAPALGANFYAAPGRTATFSLNFKF